MNDEKITILLVEDNPGDVRLFQEALKELDIAVDFHVVWDGVEAMTFLRQEDEYAEAPRPDLIFLDLMLPKKDGLQVLAEIKADSSLKSIQLVILTGFASHLEVAKRSNLSADCYITKPTDMSQFINVIKTTTNVWRTVMKS